MSQIRPKLKVEVRTFTVAMARALLDASPRNRAFNLNLYTHYAHQMMQGEWQLADPICIDSDGLLLNGHHRMRAVILYGRPVAFVVVMGYDRGASWGIFDTGKSWTAASYLETEGVPNAKEVVALAKASILCDRGVWPPVASSASRGGGRSNPKTLSSVSRNPTNTEILRVAGDDPMISEAVASVRGKALVTLLPRSVSGLCFYLFSRIDATMAKCFFDDLATGVAFRSDDPVLKLRTQLQKVKLDQARTHKYVPVLTLMAWVIKTWNLVRRDEPARRVVAFKNKEKFPKPI